MKRRNAGSTVRAALTEETRRLCATSLAKFPGCPWPAKLAALEAGEPVSVAGWEVGWPQDFGRYRLYADGRLEPVGPGAT